MDGALETEGEPRATVAAESGLQSLQMFQHRPEQLLGHFRIAPAVGVRKCVFGRRRGPAQCRQRPGAQTQGVADVIESEAVGELGIKQTDDVTSRTEGAGLIFHAGLACQSRHQMRRNEVAKPAQQREPAGRWLVSSLIIHALPCGKARTGKPTFLHLNPVSQQWMIFIKKISSGDDWEPVARPRRGLARKPKLILDRSKIESAEKRFEPEKLWNECFANA